MTYHDVLPFSAHIFSGTFPKGWQVYSYIFITHWCRDNPTRSTFPALKICVQVRRAQEVVREGLIVCVGVVGDVVSYVLLVVTSCCCLSLGFDCTSQEAWVVFFFLVPAAWDLNWVP